MNKIIIYEHSRKILIVGNVNDTDFNNAMVALDEIIKKQSI